jgi:hypothetical protein
MRLGNIPFLIPLSTPAEQDKDHRPDTRIIYPVSRAKVNPHFPYPLPYCLTVTEVASFSRSDSINNTCFTSGILKLSKPLVERFCTQYCIHGDIVSK